MPQTKSDQWINLKSGYLGVWIDAFLTDRRAQNLVRGTLYFYTKKLALFVRFCEGRAVSAPEQITPDSIPRFLFWLEETGNSPGGLNDCYRARKTFLGYDEEVEPPDLKNPMRRVHPPRVRLAPLASCLWKRCQTFWIHAERASAIKPVGAGKSDPAFGVSIGSLTSPRHISRYPCLVNVKYAWFRAA